MRNLLFISFTLLAGAIPVSADQGVVFPRSTAQLGGLRSKENNPYAKLFETRDALKQAEQAAGVKEMPKKKTVCGMTIIEADPFFDQKMKVTPPKDPNVRYTIRAFEPPTCK